MSVKIVNECVGCTGLGLPCIGGGCPNRKVERYYCDRCGAECSGDGGFGYDELCEDCYEEMAGEVNDGLYDVKNIYYIEVIGNIYDNPELLKEREGK